MQVEDLIDKILDRGAAYAASDQPYNLMFNRDRNEVKVVGQRILGLIEGLEWKKVGQGAVVKSADGHQYAYPYKQKLSIYVEFFERWESEAFHNGNLYTFRWTCVLAQSGFARRCSSIGWNTVKRMADDDVEHVVRSYDIGPIHVQENSLVYDGIRFIPWVRLSLKDFFWEVYEKIPCKDRHGFTGKDILNLVAEKEEEFMERGKERGWL